MAKKDAAAKKPASSRSGKGSQGRKRVGSARSTVRDIMVPEVLTIEPSASLADAARVMKQANVGLLPVVDEGKVKGVITDRDIVIRVIAHGLDVSTAPVGTVYRLT